MPRVIDIPGHHRHNSMSESLHGFVNYPSRLARLLPKVFGEHPTGALYILD
jgi:hypothetical protein